MPSFDGQEFLTKSIGILNSFKCKVFILPANHDFYTEHCLWNQEIWRNNIGNNVVVFNEKEKSYKAEEFKTIFFPCPFFENQPRRDLTKWIPSISEEEKGYFRIAIAHGSISDYGSRDIPSAPIDIDDLLKKDLDYIALGDQHGLKTGKTQDFDQNAPLPTKSNRIWYPGTPEQCKISEINTGNILEVTLEKPSDEPKVKIIPVNNLHWFREAIDLNPYVIEGNMEFSYDSNLIQNIFSKIEKYNSELDPKKCILEIAVKEIEVPEDISLNENKLINEIKSLEKILNEKFFHVNLVGPKSKDFQIINIIKLIENSLPYEINKIIKEKESFDHKEIFDKEVEELDYSKFEIEEIKIEIQKLIQRSFAEEN